MKKNYLFLLLSFFLPLFSLAQSNYKAGLFVNLKGDTLRGFIDYQEWNTNPRVFNFKTSIDDGKLQRLSISNASYVKVNNLEAYKKFTLSITMDQTDAGHMSSGRDTSFKIDTVFLNVLQKGINVALYAYSDNIKTRFYIGKTPDYTPVELGYRFYTDYGATKNNQGNTVIENTYQKQLFALANEFNVLDDDLTNRLQKLEYQKADILEVVSKINHISRADFEKNYAEKSLINFYAGLGAVITSTSVGTGSPYYVAGGRGQTSAGPLVALGLNFIPNRNSGRLQLRLGLSASEISYSSSFKETVYPYAPAKVSFNQLGISLTPQIIYNFYNAPDLKIYVGAGFELLYDSYSNSKYVSTDPSISISDIAANDPFLFTNFYTRYLLKAGIQINGRFEIFFNYLTSIDQSKDNYYQFTSTQEQVGFSYFFGKTK